MHDDTFARLASERLIEAESDFKANGVYAFKEAAC